MIARRFAALLLSCLAGLLMFGAYNLMLDRWAVFGKSYESFYSDLELNYHYLKTRYLIENSERYDCLIMGSSRIATIDAEALSPTCYNFTHSGGTPVQHLYDLRLLLEQGLRPAKIYIGVDDLSYTWDNSVNNRQLGRRAYPSTWWQRASFLSMYLLRLPEQEDWEIMTGERGRSTQRHWVLDQMGSDSPNSREKAQDLFAEGSARREQFTRMGPTIWYQEDGVKAAIDALAQILSIAENAGISVQLFFNPMHYKTLLANDWGLMQEFKKSLAALSPFIDFSGMHPLSMDHRYWLETSHYSVLVGDMMVADLQESDGTELRLGRIVSEESLADNLADQLAAAARLYPQILRDQDKIYVPVPVAQQLIANVAGISLLSQSELLSVSRGVVIEKKAGLNLVALRKDPRIVARNQRLPGSKWGLLELEFDSDQRGWPEVFIRPSGGGKWQKQVYRSRTGSNHLFMPFVLTGAEFDIRVDPGRRAGRYHIRALNLYGMPGPGR